MNNQPFAVKQDFTSGIFQSDNLFAKIMFLLVIIIVFIILLRVGLYIINYFMSPSDSPHLIDGMVDAQQMLIFKQSGNNSTMILRSDNENEGIEFTWSIWVNIQKIGNNGMYQHIFHKGNSNLADNGLNFPNNAPGLYIKPDNNELVVIMNTFNNINDEIEIPNIPLNNWVNVIIRIRDNTMDVYVNGTITRSIKLNGVPKQNYGDVYVAQNGGFQGFISNLWYYNYALGLSDIQTIVMRGPNTKLITPQYASKDTDYLSLRWYFFGDGDMYNPTNV